MKIWCRKSSMKKVFMHILLLCCISMMGCGKVKETDEPEKFKNEYGVFLNADSSYIAKMSDYRQVVIDVSYFTAEDVDKMHNRGQKIYSYLNVGSLEKFRDYYDEYAYLCLDEYENWEDEKWVDVSQKEWQEKVISIANEYSDKEIDGFFIDNCDVYYQYPKSEIFDGLTDMLRQIHKINPNVIINGGDTFVTEYMDRYETASDIMSGVNQECVFTAIDFSDSCFRESTEEDFRYFESYIEKCAADNMDVYLLEYTTDMQLVSEIKDYCEEKNYFFYISSSIELE